MTDDFAEGWQVRAGARAMANAIEIRMKSAERSTSSLVLLGRYVRRARGYLTMTQVELAGAAGVSQSMISRLESGGADQLPLGRLMAVANPLGAVLPLGSCPHDHRCAWQPFRPTRPVQNDRTMQEYLLQHAGESLEPGA
ncbi:MAG: Helix-turn-helix domain [Chloroflexota bacterium]|jgi:transcriptional regulator with XRE-family HTH domain|nr:Helix-turn-helix domain [Chloroflexota bacterium]